jgi:primosomal protein N'
MRADMRALEDAAEALTAALKRSGSEAALGELLLQRAR